MHYLDARLSGGSSGDYSHWNYIVVVVELLFLFNQVRESCDNYDDSINSSFAHPLLAEVRLASLGGGGGVSLGSSIVSVFPVT